MLFYEICERDRQNSLNPFVDKYLSVSVSIYSENNVLIGFIENWKTIIR